jgi:hypothetical protein
MLLGLLLAKFLKIQPSMFLGTINRASFVGQVGRDDVSLEK